MEKMIIYVTVENQITKEKNKICFMRSPIITDKDELDDIVWRHIEEEFYDWLPAINYEIEVFRHVDL